MTDRIVEWVNYSATRGDVDVELRVTAEVTTFVREVIPDGQMAGMMGHRPVPHTETVTYSIPLAQARRLYDDLGAALDGLEHRTSGSRS